MRDYLITLLLVSAVAAVLSLLRGEGATARGVSFALSLLVLSAVVLPLPDLLSRGADWYGDLSERWEEAIPSDGKLRYEEAKRAAAEKRAAERRLREAEKKIPLLENELEELGKELFGPAASDYLRAAAIEERRAAIEEELLTLYELTMG